LSGQTETRCQVTLAARFVLKFGPDCYSIDLAQQEQTRFLLACAPFRALDPRLSEFLAFTLRLADDKSAAAHMLGLIELFVCHNPFSLAHFRQLIPIISDILTLMLPRPKSTSARNLLSYRNRLASVLLLICWSLVFPPTLYAQTETGDKTSVDPTESEIEEILADLGRITGLPPKKQIPFTRMTRQELREFTEKRLAESVAEEELVRQELVLKRFGLLPADYKLRDGILDLITEQAAALYDEKSKKMVMLDVGGNKMMERIALVHELAHGLADQYFDLGRYIGWQPKSENKTRELSDDQQMARQAVAEGQATWLMIEHSLFKMGQSLRTNSMVMDMVESMSDAQTSATPGLAKAPLYMREQLIFPYTAGVRFQQEVILKQNKAGFASVFSKPPTSTQQILHPALYFSQTNPKAVKLPALPAGFKSTLTGSWGEFDHQMLFRQFEVTKANEVAAGWTGGQFDFGENGPNQVLVYNSSWQSMSAAALAYSAYWKAIEKKASVKVDFKNESCVCGSMKMAEFPASEFVLVRKGLQVQAEEGLPEGTIARRQECQLLTKPIVKPSNQKTPPKRK
jgi:hypothetical protein